MCSVLWGIEKCIFLKAILKFYFPTKLLKKHLLIDYLFIHSFITTSVSHQAVKVSKLVKLLEKLTSEWLIRESLKSYWEKNTADIPSLCEQILLGNDVKGPDQEKNPGFLRKMTSWITYWPYLTGRTNVFDIFPSRFTVFLIPYVFKVIQTSWNRTYFPCQMFESFTSESFFDFSAWIIHNFIMPRSILTQFTLQIRVTSIQKNQCFECAQWIYSSMICMF